MPAHRSSELSLAELAKRTGLTGRTIRFYIAKGLLPGPRKAGRDAAYGPEHLNRLKAIQALQKKGLTLVEIGLALAGETAQGESAKEAAPPPAAWWQYPVDKDVLVWVRTDASPWRLRLVRRFLNEMAAAMKTSNGEEKGKVL